MQSSVRISMLINLFTTVVSQDFSFQPENKNMYQKEMILLLAVFDNVFVRRFFFMFYIYVK